MFCCACSCCCASCCAMPVTSSRKSLFHSVLLFGPIEAHSYDSSVSVFCLLLLLCFVCPIILILPVVTQHHEARCCLCDDPEAADNEKRSLIDESAWYMCRAPPVIIVLDAVRVVLCASICVGRLHVVALCAHRVHSWRKKCDYETLCRNLNFYLHPLLETMYNTAADIILFFTKDMFSLCFVFLQIN